MGFVAGVRSGATRPITCVTRLIHLIGFDCDSVILEVCRLQAVHQSPRPLSVYPSTATRLSIPPSLKQIHRSFSPSASYSPPDKLTSPSFDTTLRPIRHFRISAAPSCQNSHHRTDSHHLVTLASSYLHRPCHVEQLL